MKWMLALVLLLLLFVGCTSQPSARPDNKISGEETGRVVSDNAACAPLEQSVIQLIEKAQSCTIASECQSAFVGVCPFGCYVAVNNSAPVQEIISSAREFHENCATCIYTCTGPDAISVDCIQGTCTLTGPDSI